VYTPFFGEVMTFFEKRYLERNSTQCWPGSYFLRVYAYKARQNIMLLFGKNLFKPLKIRPPAMTPIDIVLRRLA
jgi:hypothetical protein